MLGKYSVCDKHKQADGSSANLLAKQSRESDAGATFCLIFLLLIKKTTPEMFKPSSVYFPLKPSATNQRVSDLCNRC